MGGETSRKKRPPFKGKNAEHPQLSKKTQKGRAAGGAPGLTKNCQFYKNLEKFEKEKWVHPHPESRTIKEGLMRLLRADSISKGQEKMEIASPKLV